MNTQEAYDKIVEIIQADYRHPDYDRTVAVAEWAYSMMTGDDQGQYINVRLNESQDQKDQRERLYNSITGLASRQVASIFNKVRRTDGIQEMTDHDNSDAKDALTAALDTFYKGQHLREYLFDRLEYFTFYDPNAWIICERRNTVNTEGATVAVESYPLEIPCHQAIDFAVDRGLVRYLVVGIPRKEMHDDKEVTLFDYYLYAAGTTLHFHEYAGTSEPMPGYSPVALIKPDDTTAFFLFQSFQTGSNEFPGFRAGCYADPATQGRTFFTPLHYAEKVYKDLMIDKSNHDVDRTIHHNPQKYVYAPMCRYENQETGERCDGSDSYFKDTKDHKCPRCHGKGSQYHLSSQDIVVISYDPEAPDLTLPPLSNFAFYVNLPDWLPKWMAEQIKDGINRVFSAVFATQIDGRANPGPQTATEVVLDYEQAYNVLQPYAELYSLGFETVVRVSADYLELNREGLTAMHRFPRDFKMETISQLLEKYKTAKAAGVSMDVLNGIERDILAKQYRNRPDLVANWAAFQNFLPFRDKTPEMIGFILSARSETDFDRVLYENFATLTGEIQTQLETWFYQIPYTEQKRLIGEAVRAKIGEIQYASDQFQGSFVGGGGSQIVEGYVKADGTKVSSYDRQ